MASSSQNQTNASTKGGASAVPTPANSGSGGIFGTGESVGPAHDEKNVKSTSSGSDGIKRQSQDGGSMFGNLSNLKRDSQDQGTAARKGGVNDQRGHGPGVMGQMWEKFTQGTGTNEK